MHFVIIQLLLFSTFLYYPASPCAVQIIKVVYMSSEAAPSLKNTARVPLGNSLLINIKYSLASDRQKIKCIQEHLIPLHSQKLKMHNQEVDRKFISCNILSQHLDRDVQYEKTQYLNDNSCRGSFRLQVWATYRVRTIK